MTPSGWFLNHAVAGFEFSHSEPAISDFSCKGTPVGGLRNHGLFGTMEVSMTMHRDHHVTNTEDAAFDATMKIMGVIVVLAAIAGIALWYIYS